MEKFQVKIKYTVTPTFKQLRVQHKRKAHRALQALPQTQSPTSAAWRMHLEHRRHWVTEQGVRRSCHWTWPGRRSRCHRDRKKQDFGTRLIFLRGSSSRHTHTHSKREQEDKFNQELRRGRLRSGRSRQSTREQAHNMGVPGLSLWAAVKFSPGELSPSEASLLQPRTFSSLENIIILLKNKMVRLQVALGP